MKSLLENDLPAFYGVGRRCICDENTTNLSEFDLTEDNTQFVVGYKEGYASFCGNPFNFDYYRISHDYSFRISNSK